MDFDLRTLAVNLGIAGTVIVLVIGAAYRLALRMIVNYRASEKERTSALEVGLGKIADRIQIIGDSVSRFDGKLDALRTRPRGSTSPVGLRIATDDDTTGDRK